MKQLKNIFFGIALATLLLGCHTARAVEPLFEDETEQSDYAAFEEDVYQQEDATGATTDVNGDTWTKGADGHYRSTSGEDCIFSKPLNEYQCSN